MASRRVPRLLSDLGIGKADGRYSAGLFADGVRFGIARNTGTEHYREEHYRDMHPLTEGAQSLL